MIADLGLVPLNLTGMVKVTAVAVVLDRAGGGNGRLLIALPNRSRKQMPMLFDDALEAPAERLELRPERSPAALRPTRTSSEALVKA